MDKGVVLARQADAAAALEHAHRAEQAASIAKALAVLQWVDSAEVDETKLFDGAERWVRGGADGTPNIAEFVVGGIAAILGVSPESAFCRVASLLNLRHRHPSLFHRAVEGHVLLWEALSVADRCASAGLSAEACERFDRLCATSLQFQPWQRVRGQVEKWILMADPALAAERADRALAARSVEVGQIRDGHCDLWGRVDAADGLAFDDALDHVAGTLVEGSADQRRATALGIIARSALGQDPLAIVAGDLEECGVIERPAGQRLRPVRKADLVVHLDAHAVDALGEGVASVERWGHVLADRLPRLLAGCHVTVRPILDPAHLAPSDAYQLPPSMRFALEQRQPVDAFPFGARRASACDADHTIAFDHDAEPGHGQTNLGNLAPLGRYAHRLKTHGGWKLSQPSPGVLVWESPLGYDYVVTPQGSTCTRRPPARADDWWNREPPDWLPPDDSPGRGLPTGPPAEPPGVDPGLRQNPLPLQPPAA